MEIDKIIRVKNKSGIMSLKIIEQINQDIGNQIGSIGDFKNIRIEFYNHNYFSIYTSQRAKEIYFISPPDYIGIARVYKCEIVESEQPEYDFVRIEQEDS